MVLRTLAPTVDFFILTLTNTMSSAFANMKAMPQARKEGAKKGRVERTVQTQGKQCYRQHLGLDLCVCHQDVPTPRPAASVEVGSPLSVHESALEAQAPPTEAEGDSVNGPSRHRSSWPSSEPMPLPAEHCRPARR